MSDQLLEACEDKADGELFCYAPMTRDPWSPYPSVLRLSKDQLNDGIEDCLFGVDENCGWKKRVWVHPFDTPEMSEYFSFLDLLQTDPAAWRWYTMATREEIEFLGHGFEDLVVTCVNNNQACRRSLSIQKVLSQEYGLCYSFIQNTSVTASGPTYGLQVLYNLELYDTMGLFSPKSGLKLYLTEPRLFGVAEDLYVDWDSETNLAPGFDHLISVHPKQVSKLGEPFNQCGVYTSGTSGSLAFYNSQRECQHICSLKAQFERCGCVDDIFLSEALLCSLNQTKARTCVDGQKDEFNPNADCHCPNDCNSQSYDVKMSKLDWPTKQSFAQFAMSVNSTLRSTNSLAFLLDAVKRYRKKDDTMTLADHALMSMQSTFGRFTVYFSDLSMTVIDERPVYNFVMVVSNFGGLLGLYLGFSVLTVLEVVDFGFDVVDYLNLRGKKRGFGRTAEDRFKDGGTDLKSKSAPENIEWW